MRLLINDGAGHLAKLVHVTVTGHFLSRLRLDPMRQGAGAEER
jgi:hypothetical protein